jgi:carbon-monoxide dehydrogenase medium subunit
MSAHLKIKEYHRPRDLARAVEILARYGTNARVIAGGTDLLPSRPGVKQANSIDHLIDISNLDLNYVKEDDDYIRIGAATPLNAIGAFPLFLSEPYRTLSEAAGSHSTVTIKNRATVGGNLCNASSCADLTLPLLVLDAVLKASGPGGDREIPMAVFFKGANYMALEAGEILQEIRIPKCSKKTGSAFIKLRRQQTAIDTAVVNVAALLTIDKERCQEARIALGAVAPIPLRAEKAEAVLTGVELGREILHRAAVTAVREVRPISDIRATAAYRSKMVPVLVQRSLETCMQRCGR